VEDKNYETGLSAGSHIPVRVRVVSRSFSQLMKRARLSLKLETAFLQFGHHETGNLHRKKRNPGSTEASQQLLSVIRNPLYFVNLVGTNSEFVRDVLLLFAFLIVDFVPRLVFKVGGFDHVV
jgi:hypothetical protein